MKKTTAMRLFALILALMMVLCACGDSKDQISGTVTPAATEAAEKEMSLGRIEGGIYTNNYVGFQMELDSNWTYYSAEELQEIPSNVADLFKDSELGQSMSSVEQFTDMMAESAEYLATINVLCQKIDVQTRLVYAALDNEAILDLMLEQSDMLLEAYTAAGITVEKMEKVNVTFLGEERIALKTTSNIDGIPYITLQLFEYHLGQYSVTTTFATYLEDNTEVLLDLCTPLD